jgi:AAA domain (dynein-related subfamily)
MANEKKDMVDGWDRLGIAPTSMGMVPKLLDIVWHMKPRLTMCLVGDTGIGKTPIVHQWCARMNGFMRVLNFGHMTQEEISMIMFTEDASSFNFVAPEWLLELNKQAEEKGCAVLFLDEWNRSDKALVNGLFTLADERRLHNYHLHENVLVVAAMNPSDGSYLVNEAEKDHAIRKRLNFVYTVHDLSAWLDHVKRSNWHPYVPSFIKAANTFLYDTGARDAGKAFPCPSNWEKVSNILLGAQKAKMDLAGDAVRTLVEGQVGTVAARKFMEFVADQNTLIQPSEILNAYTPQSNVRKRVAALLDRTVTKDGEMVEKAVNARAANRASLVVELCEGVALELFSSMPDPSKIAAHLALYIGDLPNEILQTFVAEHLKQAMNSKGAEGQAYLNKLSSALSGYDPYKKKMKFIVDAMRTYKQAAGLIPKA